MGKILFFDLETTGLPVWKIPSDDPKQPHIVQLSCIVADSDTRENISQMDMIVKPDGWEIPREMTDIHGISNEYALKHGYPEKAVLHAFLREWGDCELRVSHNRTFDQRIIRIALKRYSYPLTMDAWGNKEDFYCTMLKSKPILKLPPKNKYGYRNPSLKQAYEYLTGIEFEHTHNAYDDVKGCMEVYWRLIDLENGGC